MTEFQFTGFLADFIHREIDDPAELISLFIHMSGHLGTQHLDHYAGGLDVLLQAERGEIDPLTITADQYDLVCNGVELSSGAVRNHDPEIMIKAFEMVRLGEEDVKKKFPAMYNAFCYGAPPHAGIAPGIDRMVMLLAGEDSIREIIPFPMNKSAQDIMMGAPSTVEQKQLDELHIAITCEPEA